MLVCVHGTPVSPPEVGGERRVGRWEGGRSNSPHRMKNENVFFSGQQLLSCLNLLPSPITQSRRVLKMLGMIP